MRSRKRRAAREAPPELDVTPFMNLMIVLVPVLLLSLVFTQTAIIELDFPATEGTAEETEVPRYLEIVLLEDKLRIADDRGVLRDIALTELGDYNLAELSTTLLDVKRRMPDKQDATILLRENTDYQTLVSVMDRVRTQVTAEQTIALFPVISLGDAPQEVL